MSLAIKTETFSATEDHRWLGKAIGTDSCRSITIKASLFVATWPTGIVPSGVVLGKVTASGLYGPYDNAAVDGRQTAVGHLFTTRNLEVSAAAATGRDTGAALLWLGEVVEAKLPTSHGLDAAAKVELTHLAYV